MLLVVFMVTILEISFRMRLLVALFSPQLKIMRPTTNTKRRAFSNKSWIMGGGEYHSSTDLAPLPQRTEEMTSRHLSNRLKKTDDAIVFLSRRVRVSLRKKSYLD